MSQTGGCSYSLAPGSHNPSAGGGASSFAVNTAAGCGWTSSGVPAWITGVPANGTGPQTINFMVAANTGVARSANILIGGQTFAVSQPGGCSIFVDAGESQPVGERRREFVCSEYRGRLRLDEQRRAGVDHRRAGERDRAADHQFHGRRQHRRHSQREHRHWRPDVHRDAGAVACSYSLNPTSHNATAAGGASSFDVTTQRAATGRAAACPRGSLEYQRAEPVRHTINFTVAANTDPAPRSANIIIGGQTFAVSAGRSRVQLFAEPDQPQRAAARRLELVRREHHSGLRLDEQRRAGVDHGSTGQWNGDDDYQFHRRRQPRPAPRTANITIGGQTFTVTQAGAAACSYSLNPTSHNATAAGGASSFDVTTTAGCGWTSSGVPAWITGGPASGTGTTTINFTVAANPDPRSRNANITIGGQTFAVTQAAAAACSYSLNPTSHNASAAGGSSSFDVNTTAGCNWTSSGVPAWITGVPGTGTGTTTINFTVAANTGPARNANIVIGGQTFAVSQANGCTYAVAPGSLTFSAAGTPAARHHPHDAGGL